MIGPQFEREVREVARALWNLQPGEGAAEFIANDEIDCVCRTEELIHLIECTTDRGMEKLRRQVSKLVSAKRYLEGRGETVKLRIVTQDEPTPNQRSHARESGVTALSIREFRKGLLDSQQYLEARWSYRFGSATNPESGDYRISDEEYVRQPLTQIGSTNTYTIRDICGLLNEGKTVVLVGPFGAGKSLTVREIFRRLRRDFYRGNTGLTPVAINLRDHWGQPTVPEVLYRHANNVGFGHPHQLVRAWNAGQLLPLLDGVDELASPVMPIGRDARRRSREAALKVVQAFMQDARGRLGVLLAVRDHYFDSNEEARRLMKLPGTSVFVAVGEFSEEQATQYLQKKGINSSLPAWLPRKPLLLGYLASRNLLEQVVSTQGDSSIAVAWNNFLSRICEREADLSTEIDSWSVRRLLEDLATRARTLPRGVGPLFDNDLAESYRAITGYEPSESARALLQRLPGLTARDQEQGARSFVDDEMMEALQAGTIARFISNPYTGFEVTGFAHPLTDFGCSVANHLASEQGATASQYIVAAREAMIRWNQPTLAIDAILSGARTPDAEPVDAQGLTINGGLADNIDMEEHPITGLTLDRCLINQISYVPHGAGIKFLGCQIIKLVGVTNVSTLPSTFRSCEVGEFDNRRTNAAIAQSDLPDPVKVLLILIRKLFLQRGSGRVNSALSRGINSSLQRYVIPIRESLISEGIIYSHTTSGRTIWHGNRAHRVRMLRILEGPANSGDELVQKIWNLSA